MVFTGSISPESYNKIAGEDAVSLKIDAVIKGVALNWDMKKFWVKSGDRVSQMSIFCISIKNVQTPLYDSVVILKRQKKSRLIAFTTQFFLANTGHKITVENTSKKLH